MQIEGKTILVTGGTDGIGARLIRQLRDKGADIITSGRYPERVAATRAEGFEVIPVDLADPAGADRLMTELGDRPIDVLVNNAGAMAAHDFRVQAPLPAETDAIITLNLHAPIHLITGLMPMLRSRPEAMIVNVTSGLAIAPKAGSPVYCATKAALRSYSQAVRAQLAGSKVHVLEVLPPVVDTAMNASRGGSKLSADECGRQIVRAIERNDQEANVGVVKLLRLVYSVSPAVARRIMLNYS